MRLRSKVTLLFSSLFSVLSFVCVSQSDITTERIQITQGATNNFILKSDALGNASWVNPNSLISPTSSFWTLNGTDIHNNNLDNVGIGIITPNQKLEVGGNIRATGTVAALGQTPYSDFWSAGGNAFQLSNGYIGTNGSFKSSWFWNGYRNNAAGWTSLGTNSFVNGVGIELGKDGIFFLASTEGESPIGTAPPVRMIVTDEGDVGVGTTSPGAKLDVNGTVRTGNIVTNSTRIEINDLGTGDRNAIIDFHGSDVEPDFSARMYRLAGEDGDFRMENRGAGNLIFRTSNTNRALMKSDGKLLIGNQSTATPPGYLLYVEDGILTERVKIATIGTADWADYVFEDDYKLRSLEEIHAFVKEHKHLPNIPSAKDVNEHGYELQKMDAKLLEKIEELYLLSIELNEEKKKLEIEKDKIKSQQQLLFARVMELEQRLANLENK